MVSWFKRRKAKAATLPNVGVDQLPEPTAYAGQTNFANFEHSIFDGEKFAGGFGLTQWQQLDYWTLRKRSSQLFNENLYAAGLIRRLVTNEINTGLTPEAAPDEELLGLAEGSLDAWTESVENRFGIWGKMPGICDFTKQATFGAIQRNIRLESLIGGDMLVVLHQSPVTNLPQIQTIKGEDVRTPLASDSTIRKGNTVEHGVELDKQRRQVAYWAKGKRIPAFGEKSGRRIAWLVYGTQKRIGEVRGMPLLAIILQSLKELDRYRDAVQRKAVINSLIAMFIKKTQDKPGTLPITGGAQKRGQVATTDSDGTPRKFNIAALAPGLVPEELQQGEEPVLLGGQGTDVNYAAFESSVLSGVAWASEVPPEILQQAFSNNYSASQAAINEFKIYLNLRWSDFGEQVCNPIYLEWLISETLNGAIQAPGLLDAWRDPKQYVTFGAWTCTDWYGSIKPSTDMAKQVKASRELIAEGLSTRAREARITTGTKYSKNIKRLKRENEMIVDAMAPIAAVEQSTQEQVVGRLSEIVETIEETRDHG